MRFRSSAFFSVEISRPQIFEPPEALPWGACRRRFVQQSSPSKKLALLDIHLHHPLGDGRNAACLLALEPVDFSLARFEYRPVGKFRPQGQRGGGFFLNTGVNDSAGAPESANNALKKQDFGKFRLHSNLTILLFALVGFLLGFLGAYSMDTLSKLVALVPAWLLKGLTVAGGMLPAIGFAMIMSVMLKKEVVPFALLGYFLAAYLGVPVIGIAIVGTVFALKHYNDAGNVAVAQATTEEVEHDDWI